MSEEHSGCKIDLSLSPKALRSLFGAEPGLEVKVSHAAAKAIMKAHVSAIVPGYLDEIDARLKQTVQKEIDERLCSAKLDTVGRLKWSMSSASAAEVREICDRQMRALIEATVTAHVDRLQPSIELWVTQAVNQEVQRRIDQGVRERLEAVGVTLLKTKGEA